MTQQPPANEVSQWVSDQKFLLLLGKKLDSLDEKSKPIQDSLRKLAADLNESGAANFPYAVLDGLSLSYSMFKYFCDVFLSCRDDNALHDLMLSPAGMAAVLAETAFLTGFSFFAAYFDKSKQKQIEKRIASSWPYVRDVLKGFKNIYKGLSSTFKVVVRLGGNSPMPILIPISLTLGLLAAYNRVFIRKIRDARKDKMSQIDQEFKKLLERTKLLTESEAKTLSKTVASDPDDNDPQMIYVYVCLNAMLDSFYLYFGVIALTVVSSTVLWPLLLLTVSYSIAGIVSRLYEEQGYQQRLEKMQLNYEMVLLSKRVQTEVAVLCELQANASCNPEQLKEQKARILQLYSELKKTQNQRQSLEENTYLTAFFAGVRHGMLAYSAVCSMLFFTATLMTLASVAIPPLLMIIAVTSGLALMTGFVGHALISTYYHTHKKEQNRTEVDTDVEISALEAVLAAENLNSFPAFEQCAEEINKGLRLDPSPQFFFQEWFEVVRSFFSGLGKGQRNVDFTFNALKEANEDGDYQDTPVMLGLMVVSAVLFAFTLGARALAKLGKNKQPEYPDLSKAVLLEPRSVLDPDPAEPPVVEVESKPMPPEPDSSPRAIVPSIPAEDDPLPSQDECLDQTEQREHSRKQPSFLPPSSSPKQRLSFSQGFFDKRPEQNTVHYMGKKAETAKEGTAPQRAYTPPAPSPSSKPAAFF